jgi:hypothetical protein
MKTDSVGGTTRAERLAAEIAASVLSGEFRPGLRLDKKTFTSTMRVLLFLVTLAPGLLVLNGCATTPPPPPPPPPAWSYYDTCYETYRASKEFFVPMAECGRANRIARCQAENNCSDLGDVLMRYADDLEQSVKQKQMSDAEAYRRLVEYETQLAVHLQKEGQAQAAADALRLRSR